MASKEKSTKSSNSSANTENTASVISLDWWAVIFALALAVIVFAGLNVTW